MKKVGGFLAQYPEAVSARPLWTQQEAGGVMDIIQQGNEILDGQLCQATPQQIKAQLGNPETLQDLMPRHGNSI